MMTNHQSTFSEPFVAGVVAQINADHRAEMLDLARSLAGRDWAEEATLLHADPHGIDLLLHGAGREERLRIVFDPPLEQPNQFRPALIALIAQARTALGLPAHTDDREAGKRNLSLSEPLYRYLLDTSLREPEVLRRLRVATAALEEAGMQIGPEQGQFMALLLKLIGARHVLEIGTFTGYSALWMALALPHDGRLIACDVSAEYTGIGRRFWQEAGVAHKIDLRLAPPPTPLLRCSPTGRPECSMSPLSTPIKQAMTATTNSACSLCAPAA